jgi:hypothetical protein
MAKNLSCAELDAEHVELLPARTLVTTLPILASRTGTGVAAALSGGVGGTTQTPCNDIPWWSPKPPGCK